MIVSVPFPRRLGTVVEGKRKNKKEQKEQGCFLEDLDVEFFFMQSVV